MDLGRMSFVDDESKSSILENLKRFAYARKIDIFNEILAFLGQNQRFVYSRRENSWKQIRLFLSSKTFFENGFSRYIMIPTILTTPVNESFEIITFFEKS